MRKANPVYIIQSVYAVVLNFIYRFTSKISEKYRDKISLYILIFYTCFILIARTDKSIIGANINYWDAGIVLGICLSFIIVFNVNKTLEHIKWNKPVVAIYYLTGILMLIASILHNTPTGYKLYILEWLVLFPALYYVWGNRRDYEVLFEQVANAFCYSGIVYFTILVIAFPVDLYSLEYGGYLGTTFNPNSLSAIGCSVAIAGTYLFTTKKSVMLSVIAVCIGINLVIMGESRTSFLAVAASFFILTVIILYNYFRDKDYYYLKKIKMLTIVIVIMIISVPVISMMFSFSEVAFADSHGLMEKFSKSGDLNAVSSGRIDIWNYCIENANLFGNAEEIAVHDRVYSGAHNIFMEVLYRYGIFALISYFILVILMVVNIIKMVFKYRPVYSAFVAIVIGGFYVMAMLDNVFLPYTMGIAFMSVFAMAPLFNKNKRNNSD